jgi:hypothetical protein
MLIFSSASSVLHGSDRLSTFGPSHQKMTCAACGSLFAMSYQDEYKRLTRAFVDGEDVRGLEYKP